MKSRVKFKCSKCERLALLPPAGIVDGKEFCGQCLSIAKVEAERDQYKEEAEMLREKLLKQTCRIRSVVCKHEYEPLGRAATDADIPPCGSYCQTVLDAVKGEE